MFYIYHKHYYLQLIIKKSLLIRWRKMRCEAPFRHRCATLKYSNGSDIERISELCYTSKSLAYFSVASMAIPKKETRSVCPCKVFFIASLSGDSDLSAFLFSPFIYIYLFLTPCNYLFYLMLQLRFP